MKFVVVFERGFALLFACFENLIHGGVIFGWPSLVFVLIQLGYFSDMCNDISENSTLSSMNNSVAINCTSQPGQELPCPEQDSRLQLVFSVAVASQTLCMFPVGFFFDRLGTRLPRLLLSLLLLIGYLLMGFTSPTHPYLMFPGTICFTIAGVILLLSTMQVGNIFKGRKSTVITLVNAMYSSASVIFLIAKAAYEAGLSIRIFFFILAGSAILLNINTFIFLPVKHIPWPYTDDHRLVTCHTPRICCRTIHEKKGIVAHHNQAYMGDSTGDCHGVDTDGGSGLNGSEVEQPGGLDSTEGNREVHSLEDGPRNGADGSFEEYKQNKYSTLRSCILSVPFCLILLWQTIILLELNFTFGTLNFFLTRFANGDDDIGVHSAGVYDIIRIIRLGPTTIIIVSWYTDVFAIIQIFVIIFGPLGGLLMDRNKLSTSCSTTKTWNVRDQFADIRDSCLPLAITSLSAVGYSVCLLIPSLPLQYLTFIFILIVRSLLFGVGASVTAIVFPMRFFASVYGAFRTISGIISFLQYPIFMLIQKYLDNDPFWVIVAFVVADCVTLLLPVALYLMSKQHAQNHGVQVTQH